MVFASHPNLYFTSIAINTRQVTIDNNFNNFLDQKSL